MINRDSVIKLAEDDEEKLLMAKAADRANIAIKTYTPEFTVFMDPYKAHSICDAFKYERDVTALVYGGYDGAERLKIGFFPEYTEADKALFPIDMVELKYNTAFSRALTHRDFLGSVLGLSIKREKIGDIIIEDGRAVVFADRDISEYIIANLERVGRTKVTARMLASFEPKQESAVEKKITVAGLRLDAVLSGALNISRGRTAELIKGEKAFVNWKKVTSVSKTVCEGEIITLRGFGRIKIEEIIGATKKDRILIRLFIYK